MNEKIYKTMRNAGSTSLIIGIVVAAVGIACGTLLIISGSNLLGKRSNVLF